MTITFKRYAVRSLFVFGLVNSTAAFCLDSIWNNWLNAVRSDLGYSVVQGGAHVFNLSDCATLTKVFGSCGGNNPAAPYIEIQPPISNGADNEFVDPCYTTNTSGCLPTGSVVNAFTATGPAGNEVNQYYRLSNQDALVVIVSLPPNAAYLGYQSYVFSRSVTRYSTAPVHCGPTAGVDLCRAPVLGSVENSINNITLKNRSTSLALPAPDATTAPEVVFISTANDTLYTNLRKTFLSAGGSSDQIFVERLYRRNKDSEKPPILMSASYSPFNVIAGFDTSTMSERQARSDEFNTLMRYSVFEDEAASKRWLCAIDQSSGNNTSDCQNVAAPLPASPIAVYRVTKKTSVFDTLNPGESVLTRRDANNDEIHLDGVDI